MKRIYNKLFLVLSVLSLAIFTSSCKNDLMNVTYTPTNANVSFEKSVSKLTLDGNSLKVKLNRGVADTDLSVPIAIIDESGIFSLSESIVNFKQGEFSSYVVVDYSAETLLPGEQYTFTLKFSEEVLSITGINEFKGNCSLPLEYQDFGTIKYIGYSQINIPIEHFKSSMETEYVLQKAVGTNNYFKILNFMDSGIPLEFYFEYDKIEEYYPVTVLSPNPVGGKISIKTRISYPEGDIIYRFVSTVAEIKKLNSRAEFQVGTEFYINAVVYGLPDYDNMFGQAFPESFKVTKIK